MPNYDTNQIMQEAQARRTSSHAAQAEALQKENEVLKLEHGHMKRKLSVYEQKEKLKMENLKKAREARAKNATSKRPSSKGKNASVGKQRKKASGKR